VHVDDNSVLSDLSNDQGQPSKVSGTPLGSDIRKEEEEEGEREDGGWGGDSSDGTLTESESHNDGKPITSALVNNPKGQSQVNTNSKKQIKQKIKQKNKTKQNTSK